MRGGLGKAPRRHDDAAAALAAKQKARAREDQRLGAAHISGVRLAADRSKIYDDEGGLLGKCECALPLPFETNGADVVEMRIEMHLALLFYIGDAGQVLEGSVGGRAELGRDAHHDEEREDGQHRIVGGGHLDACSLGVEEDRGEDVRKDGEG